MRSGTGARTAGLIAFVLSLAFALSPTVSAQGYFSQGDYWLYDLSIIHGTASNTGSMNMSYEGMTNLTVAGVTYETYDLQYVSTSTWSGTATGTTSSVEHQYVDVASQDTVIDEYNESDSIVFYSGGSTQVVNGWTYNKTTYTPPGGHGTWPSTLHENQTWTISYTVSYEEINYNSSASAITSHSGTMIEVVSYRVGGRESVTVPAGTYECIVIQVSYADLIYQRWYSDKVGNDVKIVSYSSWSGSMTLVLRSYSYGGSSPGEVSVLYLGLGAAVAVAAVVLVVLMIMVRRRRNKPTNLPNSDFRGRPPNEPYY